MGCEDCNKVSRIDYKDDSGYLCVGITKPEEYPLKDVIRVCTPEDVSDMHIVEALDLSSLLTQALSEYFGGVNLEKLEWKSLK